AILSVRLLESACPAKTSATDAATSVCTCTFRSGAGSSDAWLAPRQLKQVSPFGDCARIFDWQFNGVRSCGGQDRLATSATHFYRIHCNSFCLWFWLPDRTVQILELLEICRSRECSERFARRRRSFVNVRRLRERAG